MIKAWLHDQMEQEIREEEMFFNADKHYEIEQAMREGMDEPSTQQEELNESTDWIPRHWLHHCSNLLFTMASLLKQYIDRYPRTGAARYWIERYNWSETFDGCAPETIKLHDVYQEYGGPEEGGWWYEVGQAIGTHCIFSKKQCINRLLDLTQDLELHDQPPIDDSRGLSAIHATLGTGYANDYPTERPYYC